MASGRIARTFGERGGPVGPIALGIAGLWGIAAVILLVATLSTVDSTGETADDLTRDLGDIEQSTRDVALTKQLIRTSRTTLTAVRPVAGQMRQTAQAIDDLETVTDSILAGSGVVERESVETEATVASGALAASRIEATSEQIAAVAAQTSGTVRATAGEAQQAFENIYYTQALSGSVEGQVQGVERDISSLFLESRRSNSDERGP